MSSYQNKKRKRNLAKKAKKYKFIYKYLTELYIKYYNESKVKEVFEERFIFGKSWGYKLK